jgi:GntR family transcriptional regulator/MocR family aminotransferase
MGIFLTTRLLLKPGDNVIVGEPGYFAVNLTFQQAGAVINRVPVDEFGIDVDAIASLCIKKEIRLLYVIPHHHYPTTSTLIPERRIRLLELAVQYKFAIIEDDYDYDFHYNSSPMLPMASLDNHGNVIYIGTLTKTLVPAIRIGFMVAPENFINSVSNLRRAIDWQGDTLMEVAIAQLYKNGIIERHIKKAVKLYHERRDYFCRQLKDRIGEYISFKVPDGGMAVWTKFNGVDLKLITEKAAKKGLAMNNSELFNTGTKDYNATRLGFASLSLKEQDWVIEILKDSI